MIKKNSRLFVAVAMMAGIGLAGCSPDGATLAPSGPPISGGPPTAPADENDPPSITGQPSSQATAGTSWQFQPTATDSDGDTLTFSATGLPAWASINAQTGLIQGMPSAADVGATGAIVVRVSDGAATASLPSFSINVASVAAATGSAALQWVPPTQYTDGSALSAAELAGYRVYHGTSAIALNDVHRITSPDATRYTVENLTAGTHYFAVTAVTVSGMESSLSSVGSKTIQ